jgi:hypothetical protein
MMTQVSRLIALYFIFVGGCVAQTGMTSNYETYATYLEDAVNGIVYQTVTVDGYATVNCYFTYVCGPNHQMCTGQYPNCVNATHTPQIYNVIGGHGGWSTGTTAGATSYISYQSTTQAPFTPGVDPGPSSFQGQVICSAIGGAIYSSTTGNGAFSCNPPVTETSAFSQWNPIDVGQFQQTLTDNLGTSFDAHFVTEETVRPGTNGCWFQGSRQVQFPVTQGSQWTVGSIVSQSGTTIAHNQWGLDGIGFSFDGVKYVRDNAEENGVDLPCTVTIHQRMKYECNASLYWAYEEIDLTQTISLSGTKVCRGTVCATTSF